MKTFMLHVIVYDINLKEIFVRQQSKARGREKIQQIKEPLCKENMAVVASLAKTQMAEK